MINLLLLKYCAKVARLGVELKMWKFHFKMWPVHLSSHIIDEQSHGLNSPFTHTISEQSDHCNFDFTGCHNLSEAYIYMYTPPPYMKFTICYVHVSAPIYFSGKTVFAARCLK